MTANLVAPGILKQLRRAELTATCRLMVSAAVWQRPRSISNRWMAKISASSTAQLGGRRVAGRDHRVTEEAAPPFNAHRQGSAPAA
jgi:hypothetical protein